MRSASQQKLFILQRHKINRENTLEKRASEGERRKFYLFRLSRMEKAEGERERERGIYEALNEKELCGKGETLSLIKTEALSMKFVWKL
jgi:hypothetical protein